MGQARQRPGRVRHAPRGGGRLSCACNTSPWAVAAAPARAKKDRRITDMVRGPPLGTGRSPRGTGAQFVTWLPLPCMFTAQGALAVCVTGPGALIGARRSGTGIGILTIGGGGTSANLRVATGRLIARSRRDQAAENRSGGRGGGIRGGFPVSSVSKYPVVSYSVECVPVSEWGVREGGTPRGSAGAMEWISIHHPLAENSLFPETQDQAKVHCCDEQRSRSAKYCRPRRHRTPMIVGHDS